MMKHLKKAYFAVEKFFLTPARATPLAALRIGLSLVLLLQVYMLRHSVADLFSNEGLLQGEVARYLAMPISPQLSWLLALFSPLHWNEISVLYLLGSLYAASLLFLLFGAYTRAAAFFAWFLHWVFMSAGETTSYGVDLYAHVFLFYLIFVPAGNALSLDVRMGRKKDEPTSTARLGLRVAQLQLCITYLMSAKDKAQGEQWWNGELMWRTLTVPLYRHFDLAWTSHWPLLLKLGGWACLALEGGYFIFIWPRRTRWLWIAGMMGLHASIAVLMGLQLFGLIMAMLTLTVFGVSAERREPRPAFAPTAALS